jgi:hypothetical protein
MSFFGKAFRAEYPLNWSILGAGNGLARKNGGVQTILNFYDPVFSGVIASNTALDTSTNTLADITFSPSINMASLLNQTAIVTSSTTTNDYGYIPYIVQVDGYLPLFLNMNSTITANTTKVVVRSGTGTQDGSTGYTTTSLSSNELVGKICYVRRVLCLHELTTRPSGLNLDSSSFVGNNTAASADSVYVLADGLLSQFFLRADNITWRAVGATASRGNLPVFFSTQSFFLNPVKVSTSKITMFP